MNRNIEREFAERMVKAARAGDPDEVREILQAFIGAVDLHDAQTWSTPMLDFAQARFIADACERVLAIDRRGLDTKRYYKGIALALGLGRTVGRPSLETRTFDEKAVAAFYWRLHRDGMKPHVAKKQIKDAIGCDKRVVEKAKRKFEMYETSGEAALRTAFQPYRDAIQKIRQSQARDRRLRGGRR